MVLLDIIGVQDRNMFVLAVFGVTLRLGIKLSYERGVDITGAKSSEVCTHTVHTQYTHSTHTHSTLSTIPTHTNNTYYTNTNTLKTNTSTHCLHGV